MAPRSCWPTVLRTEGDSLWKSPQMRGVFGLQRKHPKMFRVGLYTRVSTFDQQTTIPCRSTLCANTLTAGAGTSLCRSERLALERHSGKLARNYWSPLAVVRSMWCWCGDWIAGAESTPRHKTNDRVMSKRRGQNEGTIFETRTAGQSGIYVHYTWNKVFGTFNGTSQPDQNPDQNKR